MKKWRLITGVILVFILGLLVGSVGTQVYHRQWSERFKKAPEARRAIFMNRLTKELRLTEDQQRQVEVIIKEADEKRKALFEKQRGTIRETIDESFARMKQKLDPDQQQELEELRARFEKRMKEGKRRTPLR
ncbi:MAG: hypothetical protein MUO52_07170 [Desulfobacterales bacterium]|nr:hypothetical protein [Desulfobacterales bacterium]